MTRPLLYDDQFMSLINSNINQTFLLCFSIKVQSTAFYKTLSLQNSIRISSIYDLLLGITIVYFSYSKSSAIEFILILLSFFFFYLSLSMSNNFNRKYAKYYYQWRVVITFVIPLVEFFNFNSNNICYFYSKCTNFFFFLGMSIAIFIINIYFAKIAWSFWKRLILGQELLIIHGKYLEKMLNNENSKLKGANKYIPPPLRKSEVEMINFGKIGMMVDDDALNVKK